MHQTSPTERNGYDIAWDAHPAFRQTSMAVWFSTFTEQHDDLDLVAHQACKVAAVGVKARGVRNVLSAPIRGKTGQGFGVLEVGSAVAGEFTRHDASFLQALAYDLAAALGQPATTLPPT